MKQRIDWHLVRRIAYAVRDWSEHNSRRARRYDFYRDETLCGMCAYASTVLVGCLHRFGFDEAVLVANDMHAHVRLRARLIDVTSTQFAALGDEPPSRVEIGRLADLRARYLERDHDVWHAHEIYTSADHAFDSLNPSSKNGFPDTQYWSSRSAMHRSIEQAMDFCRSRGLIPSAENLSFNPGLPASRAAYTESHP